jgi:hypothetical protein
MVETRRSGKHLSTPPRLTSLSKQGKGDKKTTTENAPASDATKPLTASAQREHDKCRVLYSRPSQTVSSITRFRLRHRVKKISHMSAAVIDGYGKHYLKKNGKELPQDVIDKIVLLYKNRIERRCSEVGLTVAEEAKWDEEEASVDEDELSNSGDESEEHDTDDVCFYSDADNDDDEEIEDISLHAKIDELKKA